MKNLKIHAGGENDYLKSLKEKFEDLKKKIINNKSLTESEKLEELEKIANNFENDKKDLNRKLF